MDSAVRVLRIIQIAMLVSVALYVFVGERIPVGGKPDPALFYVLSLVSITVVGIILVVRRTLVLQSEEMLKSKSTDVATIKRWRSGYIATYALAQSLGLFGFVLRFMGFKLGQVAPFYLGGFILMLFFSPRRPSTQLS
jgi:hypothetical protein